MRAPWSAPKMQAWGKLPTGWIQAGDLKKFRWEAKRGGHETAALLLLLIIVHHVETETGIAKISYTELCAAAGISRALTSIALDVLEERGLIERAIGGKGTIGLLDYNVAGAWAKAPARGLYRGDAVTGFQHLTLRHRNELFAIKLYLLFAAFRDEESNYASISFDRIVERTGIPRDGIRPGLSVLTANGLLHVENTPSWGTRNDTGVGTPVYNRYRLTHLDSYRHAGTSGRGEDLFMPAGE